MDLLYPWHRFSFSMFDASVSISDHWWIEPRDVTAQFSPSCDLCLGDVARRFAAGQSVAVRRVVSGEKRPHLRFGLPRKVHQKNDYVSSSLPRLVALDALGRLGGLGLAGCG